MNITDEHSITMKTIFLFLMMTVSPALSYCQHYQSRDLPHDLDSLKQQVLLLQQDVDLIKLNLKTGERKFKQGILIATIGYSVTIAGGLMLGRKQDDLGKVLQVTGGATGITGTVMMFNAFRHLSP
jgi:hypothetical protein